MQHESRISGFNRLSVEERSRAIARSVGLDDDEVARRLHGGGLDPATADKIVENVIGVYALPLGVGLNFRVNGVDRLAPMAVEEPSVIAAASCAARMARPQGGFHAEQIGHSMTAQVQLYDVPDPEVATERILVEADALLALCRRSVPSLVARGGGPTQLGVRALGSGDMVIHISVDCLDAMGANIVNSIAEAA